MRYTKSDMVLALTENIYEQQDVALIERVQRGFGVNFMSEEEFTDDTLQLISQDPEAMNELFQWLTNPGAGAMAAAKGVADAKMAHLNAVRAANPAAAGHAQAVMATTGHAPVTAAHSGVGDLAHQAAGHIATGVRAVGSTVTGGLQGAATAAGAPAGGAVHTALGHMASNPGLVGAAALGLGAAAALRMRSNMKARAAARMSGVR